MLNRLFFLTFGSFRNIFLGGIIFLFGALIPPSVLSNDATGKVRALPRDILNKIQDSINPTQEFKPPIKVTLVDEPLFIKPGELVWLTWKVIVGGQQPLSEELKSQQVTSELYMAYLRDLPNKESHRDITKYEKLIEQVGFIGEEQSYQLQCPIDPNVYPAIMLLWKVKIDDREEIVGPEPLHVIIWERDENGKIKCIFDPEPWAYQLYN